MKKHLKTEMIVEVASKFKSRNGFKKQKELLKYKVEKTEISIQSDEVSSKIGREKGNYISLNFDEDLYFDIKAQNYLTKQIGSAIKNLLKQNNYKSQKVLVVGLGNEQYACDSLGSKVVQKVFVTKPYLDRKFFSPSQVGEVYAVATGVYGTTGLDTSEVIQSLCKLLLPDVVLVIDSMVSGEEKRLAKSVQLSDTKLLPGGGVGNNRKEISTQSIGAPMIAIGVPFVVNTQTICDNSVGLIVTPQDIENKVGVMSRVIAKAINTTFNNLTEKEIFELTA